jgi:hypothetical protein
LPSHLIADTDAANETDAPVDNQQLSVRPVVEAAEMQKPKNFHLYAGAFKQIHRGAMQAIASESILQKMHFRAGARPFCQCFRRRSLRRK